MESIKGGGEKDFYYGNGLTLTASGFIKKSICFINGKNYSQFRIYHPALYIRKDVFTELKGFNIDYFISSDLDFELKLLSSDKSYNKIEDYLCIYRGGGYSSKFVWTKIKQVRTILKKYNALDTSYYILNIRMIFLMIIRMIFGNRFLNILSVYKYHFKKRG
ncbi:MAG: hypothetical protein MUE56_10310 [Ignavibacteria bacterium]|nr:hypothetical protein [Ignavibacteria bacterium]